MNANVSIKELKIPPIIYKFRDYRNQYHTSSLLNNQVYIPSVNEFNDPLDAKVPFRYKDEDLTEENIYKKCLEIARVHYPNRTEQEYQKLAFDNHNKGLLFDTEHIEKFDKQNYEQTCRDFGVFCLTPEFDNFLMWSYYSNAHTGFCIGYSSEILIDSEIFGMGSFVNYCKDFPKLPLFPTEEDHLFFNLFFTKWEIWEHEKEYRLIHTYKTGKIQDLPKNAVSEVVLGCKFPEEEKMEFLNRIITNFTHVSVSQMELVPEKFGIVKKTIYDSNLLLKF